MLLCSAPAVGLALFVAPLATAHDSPVDTVAIDRCVPAYLNRNGIPGAAVAVVSRDGVVHVAGYGRDSDGADVTEDTAFPVASVSKSFTAVAVLRLVEQGTVRLDDPVVTYLPEFAMADPRARQITVRNLLAQTSGLDDRRAPADPAESLRQRVSQLAGVRSVRDAGQRHRGHRSAVSSLRAHPGLRDSGPGAGADGVRQRVAGGRDDRRGHGPLVSAHLNEGVGSDGGRVLSAGSIHVAHRPTARSPEYAMGWIADDPGELSHSGGNPTFMAEQTLLLRDAFCYR
ncbi:serine hydrolase domain-containing protein [Nonomuraea sp. MTCD27]|uniref:serine hydrolase domain-containing protein n=1 Tax=Nonomuraea sp. MTCD27 TaxID=1676747 RepID=UPI0035C077F9